MKLTEGFMESIVLLVITAALTGFLIPYVLKRIDDRKLRELKEHEAQMARQNKLIEAQSKFLDDFSQLLWNFRYMCIKVTYYGSRNNHGKYSNTRIEYDERVWEVINAIRNEISRSRRLVSEKAYQQLLKLYERIVELDNRVSALIMTEEPGKNRFGEFSNLNSFIYSDMTKQIDDVIDLLATELRLKAEG